jgi:hypothetical protein
MEDDLSNLVPSVPACKLLLDGGREEKSTGKLGKSLWDFFALRD